MSKIYNAARYLTAFFIMFYGFAKLNGAQFTVLDSELDKPLGEVKGFWLTWYYFGYSAFYGNLIAVIQVLCGIGLLFRKTTLAAALILTGVMANILLVDYFFSIPMQGAAMAIIIAALLVVILLHHRKELIDFFWNKQLKGTQPRAGIWLLRIAIIILPAFFTYYVANYNNRHPTPLDGRWIVTSKDATNTEFDSLQRVYFEYNRAFMVVLKYPGSWQTHQFDIEGNVLTITNGYMANGNEKLKATYSLTGNKLILADGKRNISLVLDKR